MRFRGGHWIAVLREERILHDHAASVRGVGCRGPDGLSGIRGIAAEPSRAAPPLGGGVEDLQVAELFTPDDRERAAPGIEAEPGDLAPPILPDSLPRLRVEERP